jgi:hypothetical protein
MAGNSGNQYGTGCLNQVFEEGRDTVSVPVSAAIVIDQRSMNSHGLGARHTLDAQWSVAPL